MVPLAIVGSVLGLMLLFMLAEAQRNFFGNHSGDLLLILEVGVVVAGSVVGYLWRANKRSLGVTLACLSTAVALAFLGWFVHPDQIYSRALERVSDWERVLSEYRFEQSLGRRDPEAAVRLQRLMQELAARRSEYRAAEIRYRGEPEFFRSVFFTWSWWLIGVVFAAFGIRYLRQHIQQVRSRRSVASKSGDSA